MTTARLRWRPVVAAAHAVGVDDVDRALERAIGALLDRRSGGSICPSEAARALRPEDWRPLMQPVRDAAFAMVDAGRLEVTQAGEVVDGRTARGAIRLRLPTDGA